MEKPKSDIPSLSVMFPFEYQGGGYFRKKGVKKGVSAEILHGEQAIEFLYNKLVEETKRLR